MRVEIVVNTEGSDAKLKRLLDAIKPRLLFTAIGARLLAYIDESFRTKGRGRWRALRPSTIAFRKHGGSMPLQDTGRYKQSFQKPKTDNATFITFGSSVKTKSGIPLSTIHEKGTKPYVIRVKRAKVLAAQTRLGQWIFFGREVHHPGLPARPVLPSQRKAAQLVRETINGILKTVK
jgi:phage gpG-like protein